MKVKKFTTDIYNKKYFIEDEIYSTNGKEEFNIINIHPNIFYQDWLGLGGAVTNATLYNLKKLTEEKKNNLLKDYYYELNYNFLRIPIGSTDFSVESTKDYRGDFDDNVKIIKEIKQKRNIKIIATPWSPPAKFKTNSSLYGGSLKQESYNDYANYLVECINDYKSKNIKIDYLSVQNEPLANQNWESCTFELDELKTFIYKYLIPKLKDTGIILWDHNKEDLYNVFKKLYENNSSVKGIGFHWYSGAFFDELKLIRDKYPFTLLIETEMCCGFSKYNRKKWITDAEYYMSEIIGSVKHGLNVFIDWNMLLDFKGGPNHRRNYCKSPIILDKKGNDYIKTPIYYYLKHIGIINKAKVIATSSFSRDTNLEVIAFKDKKTYLIVLNKGNDKKKINIKIGSEIIKDKINKHSIITYVI
ncbi:MAG: hypothetical protein J6O41_02125 [Clostridia bacterium]|nr:hypothetical protein [Clostridia bacterium]